MAAFIVGSVRDVIQNLCFYGEKLEVGGSLSFVLGVDFIAIAYLSFFCFNMDIFSVAWHVGVTQLVSGFLLEGTNPHVVDYLVHH